MNRLGLLHNRSPSPPLNEFSAIDGDSLTDGEISWDDKVENDVYLHAMMDFVHHGKQQQQQLRYQAPLPFLFQRAVTRPNAEKKPAFWEAFFPKEEEEKDRPIPSIIYVEREYTNPYYKKQKYMERHSSDDDCSSEDHRSTHSSMTPSLRSEPWTIQTTTTTTELCEEDVTELLGLNLIGEEHWNGNSSFFTNMPVSMASTEPLDIMVHHPSSWDEEQSCRQNEPSEETLRGVKYLNFGYI